MLAVDPELVHFDHLREQELIDDLGPEFLPRDLTGNLWRHWHSCAPGCDTIRCQWMDWT